MTIGMIRLPNEMGGLINEVVNEINKLDLVIDSKLKVCFQIGLMTQQVEPTGCFAINSDGFVAVQEFNELFDGNAALIEKVKSAITKVWADMEKTFNPRFGLMVNIGVMTSLYQQVPEGGFVEKFSISSGITHEFLEI